MEQRLADNLKFVFVALSLFSTASSENDLDMDFRGTWRHGRGPLNLVVNISTGCNDLVISANRGSLSVKGQFTAHCKRDEVMDLTEVFGSDSAEESNFALYWEPLLDQLKLQIRGKTLTLCWPASVQGSCCTDMSHGPNAPEAPYGIINASVQNDLITRKTMSAYIFRGMTIDCKTLCDQVTPGSTQVNMSGDAVKGHKAVGLFDHPCAPRSEVEMKKDFAGSSVTSPFTQGVDAESTITVQIPPILKHAAKNTNKVVCTFFKNNSLFQEAAENIRIIDDVVGITVENEVIANLSEPIRIGFHHDVIPKTHSRKCVSWDTKKDPLQVNWLMDGCETRERGSKHTECFCNHLTYFSILVQLQPGPVRHLLALTVITSLGCAVSFISCVILIIYLFRKSSKRSKEQSMSIHMGLVVSLAFLNLIFFLTGVLANVGGKSVCTWVAAGLHYAVLTSFTWMGIEVFNTFWLIYMVFTPNPKIWVWHMVGFAAPAVPVLILIRVGDIYGVREVQHYNDNSDPYKMCWMMDNNKAWLAHYFTNLTILVTLVVSGFVMLFLVYRQIRTRDEWRQNRVAFLSIWGLSCLFGTTWGLTFLDFGPLSTFVHFLFCILNSFQGLLLVLRFCMLDWIRKRAGSGSGLGSTSTGSTRQQMLQAQEKS